ncbi:MAG: hypothetical protein LBD29_11505, partial [Treponema sp.]|nr:hypothetical protein [Treponema sp.]
SATYGGAVTFFTGSELSLWAGTWNAIDQYLDDPLMNSVWTNAVSAICRRHSPIPPGFAVITRFRR